MEHVISRDGTKIAFDRSGEGPPVILVGGAFTSYNGVNVTNLMRIVGERAYVKTVEAKGDTVWVEWLLTEPEKGYAVETSRDLKAWTEHGEVTRTGNLLKVTLPRAGDRKFFRAVQQ